MTGHDRRLMIKNPADTPTPGTTSRKVGQNQNSRAVDKNRAEARAGSSYPTAAHATLGSSDNRIGGKCRDPLRRFVHLAFTGAHCSDRNFARGSVVVIVCIGIRREE
jgi:hypothetical protein